ncbi:MAG: glycosyl transferase group 1 [Bacteroidetes bacterium]|nr:glycosyl transferase group 1 [Bacteroidota bacterium]
MRVFFVCSWFPNRVSKSEGFFLKHYAEAISLYNDVTVFYVGEDTSLTAPEELTEKIHNAKVKIIFFKPFRSGIKQLDEIINALKRNIHLHKLVAREFKVARPDIFHFNVMSLCVLIVWYYKLFYRIPYVYSEHWDVPLRVRLGLIKKWLQYRVGMTVSALFTSSLIVCSQAMKDAFEYFHISDKMKIISSVVFLDNQNIDDEKRKHGKKVMLHVSSLGDWQKNISGMIRATAEVAKTRSDFEFHILGYGPEFDKHNQLAASLGVLDSAVVFHGFVSDEEKRSWFEKSLFHVLFSNFEGYSLVTAESIYYGRPVIATHCGGPEDFVNDKNGVLIQPNDEKALAEAIHYLLDNYEKFQPEDLRSYGESIFSPQMVGMKHTRLYEEVLRR